MATVDPENIWLLLSQYTFVTEAESVGEDLTCTLCRKLMIDAYQTGCGCKYCRECVVGYLSEGNQYCRGGKEECQEDVLALDDNVSRIPALNKRITRVRVYCPNRPCVFVSPLYMMDNHLRVCREQPLDCPFTTIGCGSEGASKDMMKTHLNNETLEHSRLLIEAINNLRNEVGGVREGLRLSQLEMASMREELRINETARKGILEQVEEERRLRREEKEDLDLSGMALLEGAVATMRSEADRVREESRTVKHKAEVVTVKAAAVEYSKDGRGRMETNRAVVEGEERADSASKKERSRVDELARTIGTLNVGTNNVVAVGRLCFTVDRWTARVDEGETVWSPYVYSHANGYKLRLMVHPRGDGGGVGTHMSVHAVLCRGEYDAVLPWPCTHTVTVSLVNQCTKEGHRTETISCCSISKDAFKRPIDTDNHRCGWHSFVSHAALQSTEGLVVNDSVLLLVVITPPPVDVVSFTVDRFSARRAANETVWSPHFYSHANGHKLRVRVDPGGCDDVKGTHVTVFSMVCRGEDDDALVWPCRYGIAISLVNQRTNEAHRTRTNTHCTDYQHYFNRPIGTDNAELGWHSFISHADLDSTEGLVVNDSVLLRVALIPPL